MWRRFMMGRARRSVFATRRRTRLVPYSYGATVLLVAAGFLLIAWLMGYLRF